jgi:NADPH-dependent 2,4-dienoyl-CoA reductase/sulfur reductase-like enzyme/nitrite reductase/ring-hydroxylating ferredoxin subunit
MQVIARLSALRDGSITKAKLGDADVVIVRDGMVVSVFGATCPHAGAPLAEGALCHHKLICPWHKATFCIRDGSVLEPPALDPLPRYEVRIDGEDVWASSDPLNPEQEAPTLDGRTVLILGSGAGGTAAAVALRDAGFGGRIVMIGNEALEPYDRTVLSKFVLADMKPTDVPPLRRDAYWANQRIERIDATITRVDATAHQVHLADGSVHDYEAAVLATGAVAKRPNLPGATLPNVYTLRNRLDAASIVANAPRGARAVIIGSSFIGLEAASALHERGVQVTVVAPEQVPFASQFGPEIGAMFRRLHETNGTQFRLGAEVGTIDGVDRADAVSLKNGERLAADLVILGVGVSPATDFVDGVRKADDGGVLVDSTMRAADGLYAIGDTASFPFGDGRARIEHWRVAQQHGCVAASNIAGVPRDYDAVPFFWTYHFGRRFEYLGHAEQWDRLHVDGSLDDQRFVALQIRGDDVVGVVACQREHTTALLIEWMRQPLKVTEALRVLRT